MEEQAPPGARGAPWGRIIVAVIALIMGWVAVSAWQRSEVEVSWASAPVCRGGAVTPTADGGARVDVGPGTRCRMVVHVANHGWSRAYLGRVSMPGMGVRGGLPLRVVEIGTRRPDDLAGNAVLDLARTLGPGEDLTMTVELAYNPDMCAAAGEGGAGQGVPGLTVSSYEQSGERHATQRLVMRVASQHQGAACGS